MVEVGTPFREVIHTAASKPVLEGAGVRLRRAFGYGEHLRFDPFLMLEGEVEHADSMGNHCIIRAGEVQ